MKKLLSMILALVLCLVTCIPSLAAEADWDTLALKVGYHGFGGGMWRLVIPAGVFKTVPEDNTLKDFLVVGTVTTPQGKIVKVENKLAGNTLRGDSGVTLIVIPGGEATSENIDFENSKGYSYDLTLVFTKVSNEKPAAELVLIEDKTYFVVTPLVYSDIGLWRIDKEDSPLGEHLAGETNKNATTKMSLYLPKTDTYYVWAYSRDYSEKPGSRYFGISMDGSFLPVSMGTHNTNGWDWQLAGSSMFHAGKHELSVVHTSGHYARCALILITNDENFTPPKNTTLLKEMKTTLKYDEEPLKAAAQKETELQNQQRPDSGIAVNFNGKYMEFDVDPILYNDRTLVPMRAIFEALGCSVSWDEESQAASGIRNGRKVSVTVGNTAANVAGRGVSLDTTPIIKNGRTLVPLRFISEAYGCNVSWNEETQTAIIVANIPDPCIYLNPYSFTEVGTWTVGKGYLEGLKSGSGTTVEDASAENTEPAVASIDVLQDGKYRLWVRGRDFAANQPGTRTFHVSIDNKISDVKFGTHGKEGFFWQDGGIFELAKGTHEVKLLDTSGFYARCSGVFLTSDLSMTPPDVDSELEKLCTPVDPLAAVADVVFPAWAKQDMTIAKTESIENDSVKVVFYQGQGQKGSLVQNEIYVKNNNQWIKVKAANEEFGYLLMQAKETSFGGTENLDLVLSQTVDVNGKDVKVKTLNYFRSGIGTWFLPSDFEKVSDNEIILRFPNEEADLKVSFSFDDLCVEPKVTLDAVWKKDGAYSFLLFSGDGISYYDYDTVTAPLYYNKKAIPSLASVTPESALFTPMNTLHIPAASNAITPGIELTTGIVVDPSCVEQDFAYQESGRFGTLFYAPSGKVRSSFVAPCFGSSEANFKEGERYQFSFRILNRFEGWYDTYKHVAQNIYNCNDLRTNYYTSFNDAIYNTTDLLMNDFFGGWDPKGMAHYNMEGRDIVTASNVIAPIQRYLLTDNLDILKRRAVPTIAYLLSRKDKSFKYNDTKGGIQGYVSQMPSPMGEPVKYNTEVYGALYEMTQGRMPYLLDYALNTSRTDYLSSLGAKYKYTGDSKDLKALIDAADTYLENNSFAGAAREQLPVVTSFVFGQNHIFQTLLAAYEFTCDAKYLNAAEEAGRISATLLWTTGYQNNYAQSDYTVDPVKTAERILHCENYNFWWHGDTQWRLGNPDGLAKKPQDSGIAISEETVPGWLPAKAGLGAEHFHSSTTAGSTVISMNHWAGAMIRLSGYTGDEFFETQARNAMIGRFGNYVGYYRDRYITHQMHADYPYKGPDYTSIYFHHIPVFLTMLEDFLVNQIWSKSNKNIDFPPTYQAGYAYFDSYQFGQEAGKFYDQDGMWLWIDRDIIETDSVNVDYLAARKDGILGLALLNEDNKEITITVKLGNKIPDGNSYNGTAALYTESGIKEAVEITNGSFTLTIPSKGLRSVVLQVDDLKAPSWAREYTYSSEIKDTVTTHTNGKGYIIQLNDKLYHAFIYVSDMDLQSLKMEYTIDGKSYLEESTSYPFEFLIEVDKPSAAFAYKLTATKADGTKVDYGNATLIPVTAK